MCVCVYDMGFKATMCYCAFNNVHVDLVECSSCQVEGYSLTSCPSLTVPALSGSFRFSH